MPKPAAASVISVHNLTVSYGGGEPALKDVSLSIETGECVALLGTNGSGKSTLVRSILGITPTLSGKVEVFGKELKKRSAWNLIGYVPQRASIASGVSASAAEVVTSGLLNQRRLLPPRNSRTLITEALTKVSMQEHAETPLSHLSGGQQQRVLIARALVRNPELLILDEPLAGVDLANQAALLTVLAELKAQGTTMLIVLHETGGLEHIIDRAIVLNHGTVMHSGELPTHGHIDPHHAHEPAPAIELDHRING